MSAQIINLPRYGATTADWQHFDLMLGLTSDLLPVVSNPKAVISPESHMKAVGKTPSQYNGNQQVAGLAKWTAKQSTAAEIAKWSSVPDYGICLQTRSVRALDVDIGDPEEAAAVWKAIGLALPRRVRSNASKFLCLLHLPGDMQKRVIKTQHGMIEFLATGQQAIVAGTHTSGVRYEWVGGLPESIPEVTEAEFEALWAALVEEFAVEPPMEGKASTKAQKLEEAKTTDPVARHLLDNAWVKSLGKDGALHITCPFEAEHTAESADSATSYFPAHTGGYERGHFKCLHAHCMKRNDQDFKDAIGIPNDDFADFDVVDGPTGEESDESETPVRNRFEVVPVADFSSGPPPNWLIKNVLPEAALAVIFGEPGSGKSFFAFDLVAAVARGIEWRQRRVKQGACVYVVAEGASGFRNRTNAYADHHGIDLQDLPVGIIGDAPNLMNAPDVKELIKAIKAFGPITTIVLDTMAQVMPGANENSGEDMGKVLAHCKVIHKHTGALVILVHHSGKDSSKGARGWSGLRGAVDVEIEVARSGDDRVATLSKMKDGDDGAEFGFKLETVVLGQDEEGENITSCVIQEASVVPKADRKTPLKDVEKVAWRVFNDLMGLGEADEGVRVEDLKQGIADVIPDGERIKPKITKAVEKLCFEGWVRVQGSRLFPIEKEQE